MYAQITKSDCMRMAHMDGIEDAKISATSRAFGRLKAFWVHLDVAANEFWR
jgi:hypothetical protein